MVSESAAGVRAGHSFRLGPAPRKYIEAILVVPEVVLRLKLDPDGHLVTFDAHPLAALHPRSGHPTNPVEDLVPARFELSLIEASAAVHLAPCDASNGADGVCAARLSRIGGRPWR